MTNRYNQYGQAAVKATELLTDKKHKSPGDAWDEAIKESTEKENSQNKSCPRSAFLGLCEAGLVKGVPPGEYLKKSSKKLNKGYAVKAVSKLIENPKLKDNSPKELWELVISKAHDSQMDVVLALWEKQKIKR